MSDPMTELHYNQTFFYLILQPVPSYYQIGIMKLTGFSHCCYAVKERMLVNSHMFNFFLFTVQVHLMVKEKDIYRVN